MNDASEKLFQDMVIRHAKAHDWLVFHTPPFSPRSGVWRSAGKGFPDLVLVDRYGKRGVIFAELKTAIGKLSVEQEDWGVAITQSGHEYHVWRPKDYEAIVERLA